MAEELLVAPSKAPGLSIPASTTTVDVRIIDPTCYGKTSAALVFKPQISGLENFVFPSYAFLISHNASNKTKHILFDAGMRKDWETTLPPETVGFIKTFMPFEVEKDINEILDEDPSELDIKSTDISAIIWSHHHFDHRGNITKFPSTTELIWGPGSAKEYLPGYPKGPRSSVLEEELWGRHVRELTDDDFKLPIGGFPAHDFFGDGSFYLLSAPGHTVGHLCALARVTTEAEHAKPTFVFMGGDCCHYTGIFRPSKYLPLPKEIPAAPHSRFGAMPCPGAMFIERFHPEKEPAKPLLEANQGVNVDQAHAEKSIHLMQVFDADENVLVCIAHDASLVNSKLCDFYPKRMNEWKSKGLKEGLRWWFCGDFDRGSAGSASIAE